MKHEQANRIKVRHSDTDPTRRGRKGDDIFISLQPLLSLANNHVTAVAAAAVAATAAAAQFGSIFCFNHSLSPPSASRSFPPFNNKVSYDVTRSAYWFKRVARALLSRRYPTSQLGAGALCVWVCGWFTQLLFGFFFLFVCAANNATPFPRHTQSGIIQYPINRATHTHTPTQTLST